MLYRSTGAVPVASLIEENWGDEIFISQGT
jgi:hypothetical protein